MPGKVRARAPLDHHADASSLEGSMSRIRASGEVVQLLQPGFEFLSQTSRRASYEVCISCTHFYYRGVIRIHTLSILLSRSLIAALNVYTYSPFL